MHQVDLIVLPRPERVGVAAKPSGVSPHAFGGECHDSIIFAVYDGRKISATAGGARASQESTAVHKENGTSAQLSKLKLAKPRVNLKRGSGRSQKKPEGCATAA